MPSKLSQLHSSALKIAVFFATLGVVFRHGQNLHHYYPHGAPWMPIYDCNIFIQKFISYFTDLSIPCFFLISGFLFFAGLEDWSTLGQKLQRRIRTLLIPYLLWNILFLLLWLILAQIPAMYPQIVHSYGLDFSCKWIFERLTVKPIVGQFWYIRDLLIFSLFTPLIWLLYRHRILALFCFGILVLRWLPIDGGVCSTEGLVFFFAGGMIGFNQWHKTIVFQPWTQWLWLGVIVLILLQFGHCTFTGLWHLRIFLSLICFFQFSLWCASKPFLREKIEVASKYSFFIYALHGSILAASSLLLSRIVPHTPWISQGCYWLCTIGTILVIILIAAVMRRLLPKIYSNLTGGR